MNTMIPNDYHINAMPISTNTTLYIFKNHSITIVPCPKNMVVSWYFLIPSVSGRSMFQSVNGFNFHFLNVQEPYRRIKMIINQNGVNM